MDPLICNFPPEPNEYCGQAVLPKKKKSLILASAQRVACGEKTVISHFPIRRQLALFKDTKSRSNKQTEWNTSTSVDPSSKMSITTELMAS